VQEVRQASIMANKEMSGSISIDYVLFLAFIILTALGILTIYSAGSAAADVRSVEQQHIKQIYWAVTGICLFIVMLFINYQRMGEYAFFVYLACLFLLVLTLLFGRRVRGAKSWLTIAGSFGFQPSEFVKIGMIIALAKFLERIGEEIKRLRNVLIALVIIVLPMGLVLLQPDFGTALVYIPVGLCMLYFGGIKYTHLLSLLIIFGIAITLPLLTTYSKLAHPSSPGFLQMLDDPKVVFSIALLFGILSFVSFIVFKIFKRDIIFKATSIFLIFFAGLILSALLSEWLKPYQRERLIVFLKPTIDPFGAGYNIIQSKIAVGAGGLFGKGLLGGTQSQLGFLPERSTDFIFSIFAEEWGFVGSFFLLAVYGLFIYRGIVIIFETKDTFGCLLAAGLVGMFLFHIIVNVGMTIGVMPVTGIPLPFLSYGGSFLLTCIAGTSILFNIEMRRHLR
jgi:rod shape determining protein RodA